MMFSKRKHDAVRIAELETRIAGLEAALKDAIAVNESMQQRSYIVAIQREGRINKFVFARNGQIIPIETMGMMSDNVAGWREALGIK